MSESEQIETETKRSFITKQGVFSQLTGEEIDTLASLLSEKRFAPGDTIVTEGDPVDSVYFIVSGTADVRHLSIQDGTMHVESVATLEAGAAIGLNETGFYSLSGVRTATVCAITPLVTLRLSVAAFHGFALSNSHVSAVMRKNASKILGFSSNTDET
ncbi:MAG TPA: cyclic nucleotide-binding domain-containing protein [Gammaproteobacteria bacterium]|nr:cyclic nucleotide-binding domain-containing protein [Gammaproteobacteria bacterium]